MKILKLFLPLGEALNIGLNTILFSSIAAVFTKKLFSFFSAKQSTSIYTSTSTQTIPRNNGHHVEYNNR